MAPIVAYALGLSLVFAAALTSVRLGRFAIIGATWGGAAAAVLAGLAFAIGYRVQTQVDLSDQRLCVRRTTLLGKRRELKLDRSQLDSLAVDLTVRSLGADWLLVAIDRQGRRIPIIEGDPHSGQLLELARQLAAVGHLPLRPLPSPSGAASPSP